jgi:hypothetical protein
VCASTWKKRSAGANHPSSQIGLESSSFAQDPLFDSFVHHENEGIDKPPQSKRMSACIHNVGFLARQSA